MTMSHPLPLDRNSEEVRSYDFAHCGEANSGLASAVPHGSGGEAPLR
jgi:hypothetical protein